MKIIRNRVPLTLVGEVSPAPEPPSKFSCSHDISCAVSANCQTIAQNMLTAAFFRGSQASPSPGVKNISFVPKLLSLFVFSFFLLSCATEAGRAWGELDFELGNTLEVNEGRYEASTQSFRTSNSERVQIHELKIFVSEIGLIESSSSVKSSFDPTNPPAPYSNCHSGHCHVPDGSTISYEDIEKEMSSTSAKADISAVLATDLQFFVEENQLVELAEMKTSTQMERGHFNGISLRITKMQAKLSFYYNGGWKKLEFEKDNLSLNLTENLSLSFDQGEDYKKEQNAILKLNIRFIDNLDWSKDSSTLIDELIHSIKNSLDLSLL